MLMIFFLACHSGDHDSAASEDTGEPPEINTGEYAFMIHFAGDVTRWHQALLVCDVDDPASRYSDDFQISQDGTTEWGYFYLATPSACTAPHFNVSGDDGVATDPDILGVPGEELYFWVYNTEHHILYPVLSAGTDFYAVGSQTPPFDSTVGWEYKLQNAH